MSWNEEFSVAQRLISKGLFSAASAILQNLEKQIDKQQDRNEFGELYCELGKIYLYKDVSYKKALHYFTRAIECTTSRDKRAEYTIYLAITYLKMAEFDTCYRYLNSLTDDLDNLSNQIKGKVFANLSAIQGINGFYNQVILSIDRSKRALAGSNIPLSEVVLNNNKGLAYLEMGSYDKAEYHLKRSLELGGGDFLEPLSELGRLCLLQGRIVESIGYAVRALNMIWASIINYNKEELALLCNLLANITIRLNEQNLAMRLGEKAQVFFGQLGMWRQWQNIESQLEQWLNEPPEQYTGADRYLVSSKEIHHFLQCLEALNA